MLQCQMMQFVFMKTEGRKNKAFIIHKTRRFCINLHSHYGGMDLDGTGNRQSTVPCIIEKNTSPIGFFETTNIIS